MMESPQILVVDDDPGIRFMLEQYLSGEGLRVSCASNGEEMRQFVESHAVDLVVLDLVLPNEDGLALARWLRARSDVPIVMLTGKGEVTDRIVGLEVGADDYMAKPFDSRELLARIRSVLRRQSKERTISGQKIATFDGWRLDFGAREITAPDGEPVPLTTAEFNLLAALASQPQRPVDRDQLFEKVMEREWTHDDRSIDMLIGKLRRKMEPDPKRPRMIKTVRNMGYMLAVQVELQ